MRQEDKELLLQDLCARLPYGVMLNIDYYDLQGDGKLKNRDVILSYGNIGYCSDNTNWVSVKPYLRPMSSMTEEEEKEISILLNYEFYIDDDYALVAEDNRHRIRLDLMQIYIDYLNAHHFDHRNLIERGLAIAVTEENDPYKE